MLKKICTVLITCLLPASAFAVDGCVLYGHAGFTGGSFQMAPNDEFVQFSSDIDNKISSVIVGPHCKLEAHSEWLFEGEPQHYPTGSYPAITPNDAMTSARCICEFVFDPS